MQKTLEYVKVAQHRFERQQAEIDKLRRENDSDEVSSLLVISFAHRRLLLSVPMGKLNPAGGFMGAYRFGMGGYPAPNCG